MRYIYGHQAFLIITIVKHVTYSSYLHRTQNENTNILTGLVIIYIEKLTQTRPDRFKFVMVHKGTLVFYKIVRKHK